MCEFCGCGLSKEQSVHEANERGKPVGVRIVAAGTEAKAHRAADASWEETHLPRKLPALDYGAPASAA
ncbi:MAG: hypothetical protein H0T80_10255 [Betaproteobacteria bacterium]|nr:hypothetical protein [Betaproteobacteria bacterium]MBA3777496.1 hypothetical protein [Betaproteobacteria bacterium]